MAYELIDDISPQKQQGKPFGFLGLDKAANGDLKSNGTA